MVSKEELRLGQRVLVGDERREAEVVGLTLDWACVSVCGGGYVYCEYGGLYDVEER